MHRLRFTSTTRSHCSAPATKWSNRSGRASPLTPAIDHPGRAKGGPCTTRSTSHPGPVASSSSPAAAAVAAAAASSAETSSSNSPRRAVVVGAGPAGCLVAMLLAGQGWSVDVFEKRPQPAESGGAASKQRSWVLALYPMGIQAIQKAGIDIPLIKERRYKGLVVNLKGGRKFILERPGALLDRTSLANALLAALLKQYSRSVRVHFNSQLDTVDFANRVAHFRSSTAAEAAAVSDGASSSSSSGSTAAAAYDLLAGADGSNSAVRQSLLSAFPDMFKVEVLTESTSQYKSFYNMPLLPEVRAWDPDAEVPNRDAGHFFFVQPTNLPGAFMSTCTDTDGTCCGYLSMAKGGFDSITSLEAMETVIRQAGPLLPESWVPAIAQQLMQAPVSKFPVMSRLSRFAAPGGVVLLGDAAHTVTPALGQGVNSALTDASFLADMLAKARGEDLDATLAAYSTARAPEIAALQELELLQSAMFTPGLGRGDAGAKAALLLRKWLMASYFGLRGMQTAADYKLQEMAGNSSAGVSRIPGAIRSPPMSELLTGNVTYSQMLLIIRAYWLVVNALTLALGSLGFGAAASALGGLSQL